FGARQELPVSHLRVAEIVAALSQALDLGSGSTLWHSVRTCLLSMRIATEIGLSKQQRNCLFYAALLKDAGSSGNPITHELQRDALAVRCERGGTLARLMGLPEETAASISAVSERWNGLGNPRGLSGTAIPLAARIVLVAQTLDLFYSSFGSEPAIRV